MSHFGYLRVGFLSTSQLASSREHPKISEDPPPPTTLQGGEVAKGHVTDIPYTLIPSSTLTSSCCYRVVNLAISNLFPACFRMDLPKTCEFQLKSSCGSLWWPYLIPVVIFLHQNEVVAYHLQANVQRSLDVFSYLFSLTVNSNLVPLASQTLDACIWR